MSNTTELADLYSAIEETAGLLDVPCSRERIHPILAAFEDSIAQAIIAFRVSTWARNDGDLDCRIASIPKSVDPLAVAVERGLIEKPTHPSGSLLGELHRDFPVESSGIDFGVVAGFTKTWSFFPTDALQSLSDLIHLESMPPSVAAHLDYFQRYGLADRVSLIGIDYPQQTLNLYFGAAPAQTFTADGIRSILRDAGLPEPTERLLSLCTQAFGIYATLSWNSPRVERITIAAMTQDPMTLPVRIEPKIERYVREAPSLTAEPQFVYAIAATPSGEYHKLQSFYKWKPHVENVLLVSDIG
ncbi:aromatic prenyltransferase [Streptomyces sp. NPDC001536]|uniref:aromatic prenyltransferase n=1 Tax=Streptomyces sp. NPDC001536 TaxID=3364583 RepID=UPI0036CF8E52